MRHFLIGIAIAAILTGLFVFSRKKDNEEDPTQEHDDILRAAFGDALKTFPKPIVQNAERIYLDRTANFTKSFSFMINSAGMEAISPMYPYGWGSLSEYWTTFPQYKPVGTTTDYEFESPHKLPLIVFPTMKAGVFSLCKFLEEHNNNMGRWYSLLPGEQALVNERLQALIPVYTA